MIVRHATNARFTHDHEALLVELVKAREFCGVDLSTLAAWLKPLEMYSYSADYYWNEETAHGTAVNDWGTRYWKCDLPVIALWKVQETSRRLLQDHGFNCIMCRSHCDYEARGKIMDWRWAQPVHDRQFTEAPPLVCGDCAADINVCAHPYNDRFLDAAVERIASRLMVDV